MPSTPLIKRINGLCLNLFTFTAFWALSGCSDLATPPATPRNSDAVLGAFGGIAAGAAVGAVSTGVSIPLAAAMGGITGGAIGASLEGNKSPQAILAEHLAKDKVQVINVGEDTMMVLPSTYYFYPNSTHFNEQMYPALKDIATFIKQYDVETVKVAGYTSNQGDEYRNVALSRQQAQTILQTLWFDGVRPSFIYSIGYGSAFPIAYNDRLEGQQTNNRVQITFRRLSSQS